MSENLILKLMVCSILIFVCCLFACEIFFPNDGQMFQVIAGLVTGFSGAFLMFLKNKLGIPDTPLPPPLPGTQRTTKIDASTTVKEETNKIEGNKAQ